MAGPLAQKIRAKFPGVYDDLDDASLEKAILAKYPDYADLAEPEPQAEEKSVGGFLGNVVKSGGRFVGDIAQTVMHPIDTAKALGSAVMHPIDTATAIGGQLKERYGGLENIGNTLYEDPVGVLADVSTLAGVGAAAKVPKVAGSLRKIEAATNPARLIGKPIQAGLDKASSTVIKGTLRPPAAVRADFGGADEIAKTVKQERVFSNASSGRKVSQSSRQADDILKRAEASGVGGVPKRDVADAVRTQPAVKALRRKRLGEPDQTVDVDARADAIEGAGGEFALGDAQNLKREAQELAYESGAQNLSVAKAQQQAIAQALRRGIEQQVPEVAPVNARTQRLIGTQRAFEAAEDRPNALGNMMALGVGGTVGAGTGSLMDAALSAALMKAINSPRMGAMAGIGLNELGNAAIDPNVLRAALVARLLGQEQ
jgi:hypothetical protein